MSFHWRHGVTFERFDGGDAGGEVRVTLPVCIDCGGHGTISEQVGVAFPFAYECPHCAATGLHELEPHMILRLNIPAAEWASIIAAVSAIGETAEQYQNAQLFHNHEGVVMFNTIPTYTP